MKKLKRYVQNKLGLLLLILGLASIQATYAITIDLVNQAIQQPTLGQQINALANLVPAAQGKTINTETQNTFGTALVQVFNQRNNATAQDAEALKGLLGSAAKSGLLNPAQQAYINNTMLPQLLTTAPVQQAQTAQAQPAQQPTTPALIENIQKEQDIITKIQNLHNMMQQSAGKQIDQNTQSAFATAIVEAFNEARTTQSFILQVLNAATQSSLLNAEQQKYVRETMIPELTVEVPAVPAAISAAPTQTKPATALAPAVVTDLTVQPTQIPQSEAPTSAPQTGVIPTATAVPVAVTATVAAPVGTIPLETTKKKKKRRKKKKTTKKRKKKKKVKKGKKRRKVKKKKGTKKKKRRKKKKKKKATAASAQIPIAQTTEQLTIPLA